MALFVPLQLIDSFCRCCGIASTSLRGGPPISVKEERRLAELLIADASSIFDIVRWRRVSKIFREVADKRLRSYTRVDVRMYDGIARLHKHVYEKNSYEWHPHGNVALVELGPHALGLGIDVRMKGEDVKAMIQLLTTFRHGIQELYMDSPVIDVLVHQINRQQLNVLLGFLRKCYFTPLKKTVDDEEENDAKLATKESSNVPYGPFFPQLKKLTITSKSNQLEHLSRLLNYAVGVDYLYESSQIDYLCLKICMGTNTKWWQKQHIGMFRHVTNFRQWTDADSLGVRYIQQFSGKTKKTKCFKT